MDALVRCASRHFCRWVWCPVKVAVLQKVAKVIIYHFAPRVLNSLKTPSFLGLIILYIYKQAKLKVYFHCEH